MRRSNGPEARAGLGSDSTSNTTNTSLPAAATRITVSLTAKVVDALRSIVARTHLSQTDIVNRALSLYEFIDSELADGADLIIRKDGKDHVVKLL